MLNRRSVLQLFGAGAAAMATSGSSFAANPPDQFFVVVFAAGGWDVTLFADPRNERKGLVEPASTATLSPALRHWKAKPLGGGVQTFEILEPTNTSLRLGPAIGGLYDLRDRLAVINGIAINTVSHADGTTLAVTGRHRSGGHAVASSIDVVLANELGKTQLLPDVAIRYPSSFVGANLDKRLIPTQISHVEAISKSLARSDYFQSADRDDISLVLSDEARELGGRSKYQQTFDELATQHEMTRQMLGDEFRSTFDAKALRAKYPVFDLKGRQLAPAALSAAFAVEALQRNLVRCIAFSLGGLDTHDASYMQHGTTLQDLFDVVANLVHLLDTIPHPTRSSAKLSEHTHVLVLSEFCRTPQINLQNGRDHYPNNSALVISPRFRGGRSYGSSDPDQLLPVASRKFTDGVRAIAPADVLATFLGAFKIDPRKYMRDGEVMKELLV